MGLDYVLKKLRQAGTVECKVHSGWQCSSRRTQNIDAVEVKVRWKILLVSYPYLQMVSGYDAVKIMKIYRYLLKLQ